VVAEGSDLWPLLSTDHVPGSVSRLPSEGPKSPEGDRVSIWGGSSSRELGLSLQEGTGGCVLWR
jgi:hypothetical protein